MMIKEEFLKKLSSLSEFDKELMLEKMAFCNLSNDWDFENYFKMDQLSEADFFCLVSFLYHQDCYLMLLDILNRYKERCIAYKPNCVDELEFTKRFAERLAKMGISGES